MSQPEALRIADRLSSRYDLHYQERAEAAALLRAQHAEIEADNRNLGQLTDEVAQCRRAIGRKDALLKQALEVMDAVDMGFSVPLEVYAAITKELAK